MVVQFHGIHKSSNKRKKYVAVFTVDGKRMVVGFGDPKYDDYTTHKDYNRMLKYRNRHAKDNIANPLAPGALSWYILWSAPSLEGGLANYKSAFKF